MALEGLGMAWVPQLSVRAELARGELVVCGGPRWHVPLEIRLYRCALVRKANVRLLWRKLEGGAAQNTYRTDLKMIGHEPDLGPNAGQMWEGLCPG